MALARAYSGDTSLVPRYIGFMYGDAASPLLPQAGRNVSWKECEEAAAGISGGGISVSRLSGSPRVDAVVPDIGSDDSNNSNDSNDSNDSGGSGGVYVVKFNAITRSGSSSGGVAGEYVYRALLLGDPPCGGSGYSVLAVADLGSGGVYRKKPDGYEISLDWSVAFK